MPVASTQSYAAFGLTVAADIELPELPRTEPPSPDRADVVVERGTVDRPRGADDESTVHCESADEYYLLYPAADVLVADGRRIVVDPAEKTPHEVIRHLVIGPAFNHLLHQRDVFVLHASAVAVDGAAVAFVGESGQGKTTTAAAFLRDGHRVLSDDVAAITFPPDGPVVRSGYPSIKLDPAVVDRFDLEIEQVPRTCGARDRHFYRMDRDQPTDPVPLERIYRLEDGGGVEIGSMPPERQLMTLVSNTYTVAVLGDTREASTNFDRCATLAETVGVRRLRRPRRLEVLSDVVEAVRTDLG